MSKDMLGSVVRAAVGVPQDRMDVLAKIASAMAANNPAGRAWHECFKAQLEKGLPSAESADIRVDSSVRPSYPDWIEEVMHPELEATGPTEYSITEVEQWLHEGQKDGGWVKGQLIYDTLKSNNMLKECLGLRDLEEVQKKGIAFFREHFQGKAVFGWKSLLRDRGGGLGVPYLCEHGGEVVVRWHWLGHGWGADDPALRFAS